MGVSIQIQSHVYNEMSYEYGQFLTGFMGGATYFTYICKILMFFYFILFFIYLFIYLFFIFFFFFSQHENTMSQSCLNFFLFCGGVGIGCN